MPTFSCSAILFDLDGVLVDSTRAVDREWRAWARQKGVDGDAIMAIAHGVRTIEVIRRVAPQLDAEKEAKKIESHEAHDKEGVVVMPGAIELVHSIPKQCWGVVTSGSRLLASARLRFCGLPVPKVLVTADDVAKSVVAGTSSSRYTSANYWPDPKSGIGYQVQVEIPEHRMNSLEEVKNLPIARRSGGQIDLRDVAGVSDGAALGEYDRYNMQRMLTLSANIYGEDLGRAAARVQQAINDTGKPPDRVNVTVRGQVQPMAEMFGGLRLGLVMAVGVILVRVTEMLPYLGGWVKFAVLLWGMGAISLAIYRHFTPARTATVPVSPAMPPSSLPPNTTIGSPQPA